MKYKLSFIIVLLAGIILKSCTGMDEVYKEFMVPEIVYVGKADSLKALPGDKRLALSFELRDPSITNISIYWNNNSDSTKVDVTMEEAIEYMNVEIKNLNEGTYSFDVITHNNLGHSSIKSQVVGQVYGEKYASSLLDTPVKGAYINEDDHTLVDIDWGNPDEMALGMELYYTNASGEEVYIYSPATDNMPITILENHKEGTNFRYRTLFKPDPLAIDTFHTEYKSVRVKGIAVEYDRSAWTSSGAEDGNRPPQNMLDGNKNSVWHMSKAPQKYPHSALMDMKQVNTISGFYLMQRDNLDGAVRVIELRISLDGQTWKTLGEFNLKSERGKQYMELVNDVECQFVELIAKSDYKGGHSTAIAEFGAYKR